MTLLIPSNLFDNAKNQFLAILWVDIISCMHGAVHGWLSPAIYLLLSDNTPLDSGKITVEQASWIGSLIAIGGTIGIPTFSLIGSKFGRKNTLGLLAIPNLTFWIMIRFATNATNLYIARFIAGFTGGGLLACIPIFVSEISSPNIRGVLGNIFNIVYNLGILLGFVLGACLHFQTVPLIMIPLPILYLIGLFFLPETPQHLLKQNEFKKAEKALQFYRNFRDENVKCEIEYKKFTEEFEKLKLNAKKIEKKLNFYDFFTSSSIKGFVCGLSVAFLNTFSGHVILICYTATILNWSGTTLNPDLCTIVIGIIQLFGTIISTILVDKIGRRKLLTLSSFGACLSLCIMGVYTYLNDNDHYEVSNLNWIPVTTISLMLFISAIGFIPLTIIIIPENFPINIRTIGTTICMTTISFLIFVNLKIYPVLMEIIGLHICVWIFSFFCALGTLFGIFVLKETKGKDINIVENN